MAAAMLAGSGFARVLREVAPGLTRRFFTCHCQNTRLTRRLHNQRIPIAQQTASFRTLQASARSFQRSFRDVSKSVKRLSSTTPILAQEIPQAKSTTKASFFPDTSSDAVGYWLLASAVSVFGIVVFGGLTRLTESGYESFLERTKTTPLIWIQAINHRMEARHWLTASHV
jgi:heme a synthase